MWRGERKIKAEKQEGNGPYDLRAARAMPNRPLIDPTDGFLVAANDKVRAASEGPMAFLCSYDPMPLWHLKCLNMLVLSKIWDISFLLHYLHPSNHVSATH